MIAAALRFSIFNFMPPGPAYNFLCVLSSTANILTHAARIRAKQSGIVTSKRKRQKLLEADAEQNNRILASTRVEIETKETSIRKEVNLRSANYSAHPTRVSDQLVTERDLQSWNTVEPEVQVLATRNLQSSKVPSSGIGRLFHYGGQFCMRQHLTSLIEMEHRSCSISRIWSSI